MRIVKTSPASIIVSLELTPAEFELIVNGIAAARKNRPKTITNPEMQALEDLQQAFSRGMG